MRTQKPIVLVNGHITKKERLNRTQAEQAYKVSRLRLTPPDELTDRAKQKFNEIASEAFWLDELSTDLLAAYCYAWDRWLNLVAETNTQPDTLIIKTKDGTRMRSNPNRTAITTYVNQMQDLSAKLAIGNIDRLKLSLPTEDKKENKFNEFMTAVE